MAQKAHLSENDGTRSPFGRARAKRVFAHSSLLLASLQEVIGRISGAPRHSRAAQPHKCKPSLLAPREQKNPATNQSMLRSVKRLYGSKLGTSEGEIGHVKDFYFDDQQWVVRYVVVDTGAWLPGRLVLISPHAFGYFFEDADTLLVHLTRKQIEDSPAIELHRPISRQYERDFYRYYGWPPYWQGGEMWGPGGFPMDPPPHFQPTAQSALSSGSHPGDDPDLRSTKAVCGYHVQTREGAIGHVTDLMIDDKSWVIGQLVVETGHWYAGKEIVISPKHVDHISYEESAFFVNVTKEAIQDAADVKTPTTILC